MPRFTASSRNPVRDLNFKYMAEGKGATVTARFGKDGMAIVTQFAPAKAQTRCSSGFTTRRFDLHVAKKAWLASSKSHRQGIRKPAYRPMIYA